MAQFVVIVDFEVQPENANAFVKAAAENAEQSVKLEPGCSRFDVICALDDKSRVTFYEVFSDVAAFEAHAKMPHAAAFIGKAKAMVLKQSGRRGQLIAGSHK
jgi:quinol monooxygenase YgiN